MGTQTVSYYTPQKINCGSCGPADVILCVPSSSVAAKECNVEGETTYPYRYIEAVLILTETIDLGCNGIAYNYTFTYDDTQVTANITSNLISGVLCKGCLTDYIEDIVGNEVSVTFDEETSTYTITTQHGCVYEIVAGGGGGSYTFSDTASVDLTLTGSTVTADVNLSGDVGNQLEERVDGLYVPASGGTITVSDTASVDLTLTGSNLEADVKLSATAGNQITENVDGLYVPASGGTITVTDTASVDLTLTGSTLEADVKLSATAGNQITENVDGLYVPASTITVTDTDSIDLTITGSALEADVIISPDAGNGLELRANGLYAPLVGGGGFTEFTDYVPTITVNGGGSVSSSIINDCAYAFSGDVMMIRAEMTVVATAGDILSLTLPSGITGATVAGSSQVTPFIRIVKSGVGYLGTPFINSNGTDLNFYTENVAFDYNGTVFLSFVLLFEVQGAPTSPGWTAWTPTVSVDGTSVASSTVYYANYVVDPTTRQVYISAALDVQSTGSGSIARISTPPGYDPIVTETHFLANGYVLATNSNYNFNIATVGGGTPTILFISQNPSYDFVSNTISLYARLVYRY